MATPTPAEPLAALAASLSEPVACAGNRPIRLDDPHTVWFVEHGVLDLFVTEERDGRTVSRLKHVLRVGAGRLVFGAGATGEEASLITVGKGLPGCRLRRMGLAALMRDAPAEELTAQVDLWIAQRAASLAADITFRPRPDRAIGPGERLEAEAACTLAGRPGAVTWVAAGGQAEFLGTEPPEPGGTGLIALTPETWLSLHGPARVSGISSLALHAEERLAAALEEFHRMLASAGALNRRLTRADVLNRETSRVTWRRRDRKQARRRLFGVLRPSRAAAVEGASALRTALESIGRHEGIEFRPPRDGPDGQAPESSVPDVLHASGVRGRRVKIRAEDRWWRGDSGALLGFRADDGRPVALLPSVTGGYRILDPDSGRATRVDAAEARRLSEDAWCFYRPLPHDAPVTPGDLLRHAGKNLAFDLSRFLVAGALAGLVTLAPAVLIGVLADRVLPMRAGGMLAQLATGLAVLAVVAALLQMLQGTALMRLEGRIAARLGAAVWDRVLGMRAEFFRRFTAGDLAVRVSVFQALRDAVSGMVGGAILSVVFLVPAFFVVFLYDAVLGWVSLGLGALSLGVAVVFALAQLEPQRRRHAASRLISGDLFQIVRGIAKLRSSGAEESAYAVWARRYREQQRAMMQIGRLDEHMVAFSAAVPALAGAALFAFALRQDPDRLAVGDFLAVYAMSMIFFVTVARLGRSFEAVAAIVPGVAQVRPVLDAVPERLPAGNAAFEPGGELRLDRVSFRYSEDGPPIVEDVSLHVRPGGVRRHRRGVRLRQEHAAAARAGAAGADGRRRVLRRARSGVARPADAAAPDRRGDAGRGPAAGQHPGEHHRNVGRPDHARCVAGGPPGRGGQGRRGHADGHVHRGRRQHRDLLRRPDSAHPAGRGTGAQAPDPVPRRGHALARRAEPGRGGGGDRASARDARGDRPPPVDDPRRGSDLRAGPRAGRPARRIRGADGVGRPVS